MAFYYCEELKEIVPPDSIKNIGEKIFGQCHKLRKVTLSKNISGITEGMFMGCHHLEEVTIPEGITSIGKDSFSEAGNSILLIPNTVTSISKEALNSSWGLSVIRFTGSKEEWDKLGLTSNNIHNATVYYNYDPNHEHSYEPHVIEASTCTEKRSPENDLQSLRRFLQ